MLVTEQGRERGGPYERRLNPCPEIDGGRSDTLLHVPQLLYIYTVIETSGVDDARL